ncbi:BrnT family toxin [Bifidobacterium bifidum]|uniref:BrnT family toxin n=2 Tax=Bifidobacterium bifidum TaxID=1681 RepID=UPI003F627801
MPPVTLTAPNPGNDDVRHIVLGMIDGRHWTAITTKRGKRIRIIPVRRSRKNEKAYYESKKMMPRRSSATSLRRCSTTATTSSAMSISAIP